MAQEVMIAGATYSDVPSIIVPDSNSIYHTFVDSSDATASASTILSGYTAYVDGECVTGTASSGSATLTTKSITANGTYNASDDSADGYSSVTVNVSGGGGTTTATKSDVNFYDYDGTILYSYTSAEALALTALPDNPSHDGLTAQGWNYTLAQMKTEVNDHGTCDIGQMYVTDDDTTRIYCTFEDGRLTPYFGICPNGTVVVDWGDSSSTDTLTGTSLTSVKYVAHTYATAGDYTITLTVSGTFAFYGVSNTSYILRKSNNTTASINAVYTSAVKKIELGSTARIGDYAFSRCHSLASVTIPSGVTSLGTYAFYYCYSLASISIPSGVTSIGNYAFYYCHSLASVTIPSGVTSLGTYVFYYLYSLASISIPSSITSIGSAAFRSCYSLASISIPSGVTSIGTNAFRDCRSLASITLPSGVTSIGTYAFNSCYGMAEYHLLPTTPPTLSNTNAFANIQSDCVIYVPSDSLTAYQEASNWSTYASYMVGE